MNILFYCYGSICEPFIEAAFSEAGFQVTKITEEITNKQLLPSECVTLVSNELLKKSYDFVFTINYYPSISDTCNIFHIPYVGWTVDAPVMELYSDTIQNPYNYIFLFDRMQYADIAPLNPGHIFYLPLATDASYWQSVIGNITNPTTYVNDISFVGSLYTEKCPYDKLKHPSESLAGYLDGILNAQVKIYGYDLIPELLTPSLMEEFKACMPDYFSLKDASTLTDRDIISKFYMASKVSSMERTRLLRALSERLPVTIYTNSDTSKLTHLKNKGTVKTRTEMPLVFHGSTINLNMTTHSIRSGIPLRIWDVLGCEGFLISNYQAEIPEYFIPGEDIELYESEEDLIYKCSYYLEHPSRAKEIAHNGFEKVKAHHTYLHRILEMLEIVFANRKA